MEHIRTVLREVLRRLYMGRRDLAYWKALRSYQRDPRSRYTPPKQEAPTNGKRQGLEKSELVRRGVTAMDEFGCL